MLFKKEDVVCPVCVSKIKHNDIRYKCQNMSCDNSEQSITKAQLIARKNKKNKQKNYVCESCGGNLVKYCEVCGTELPVDIEDIPRKTIAVFGIRASGKSSYIGSLLREFHTLNEPGDYFVSNTYFSDEISDRVEYDYLNPLEDARLLDSTYAGESKVISSTLTIGYEKKKDEKLILTLFDMAGESFTNMDAMKMADQNNYMQNLSGIIFLIDPLMKDNQELIKQLPDINNLNVEEVEHNRALTNVVNYLRINSGLRTSDKINIPTAFVVGKIDVLEKVPKYSTMNIFRKTNFIGKSLTVNENEVDKNDAECSKMLYSWSKEYKNRDMGRFVTMMKTNFNNYKVFGVSALGKEITSSSVMDVNPIRLFEPVLWIFSKNKLIGKDRW